MSQREGEKDGVARGDIRHRDFIGIEGSALGHSDGVVRQRGVAEHTQIDACGHVTLCSQAFSHPSRGFQLDAVPLPVIEGKGIACVTFEARQSQTGGGIQPAAQQTYRGTRCVHFGSLSARKNPISGNSTSPINAPCIENTSDTQPVRGMKIRPADPQANPIIRAEMVPVCEGASSWPITTFTGIVKSKMRPPSIKETVETRPVGNTNRGRNSTEPIMEAMLMRRPPKRSAMWPPRSPPTAPPVRNSDRV